MRVRESVHQTDYGSRRVARLGCDAEVIGRAINPGWARIQPRRRP